MYTALITPFDQEGKLDHEGLKLLIKRQIGYANGLLALGTTAEAATLTNREKKEIISLCKEQASQLPLMVGCGSYSTSQTLENIKKAADLGADSALVITPYYNRPTQEGIYRHYEALHRESPLPIILYNNPSRTTVNIEVKTLLRIAQLPNIVGVKETSGNLQQITEILCSVQTQRSDFAVICGDDHLAFATLTLGLHGLISPTANLIPQELSEMIRAINKEELSRAREIHLRLTPLFRALQCETNPIPLKAVLSLKGLPAGEPRLPLTPLQSCYLPLLQDLSW